MHRVTAAFLLLLALAAPAWGDPANGQMYLCVLVNGTCQVVSSANPLPAGTSPSNLTATSLDVSTVAGAAVNALSAGHATKGGFVVTANAAGICVNQKGAAGTASNGDTTCVGQNVPYYLAPSTSAVSVNSTANPVTLAGYGYN